MTTLLEKAQQVPSKRRLIKEATEEEIELALANLKGEIQNSQLLQVISASEQLSTFLIRCLRAYFKKNHQ